MRQSVLIVVCILGCCFNAASQYTYFNQLSIDSGLEFGNYDTGTNLEVVGNEIIVWGGKAIDGIAYQFVRRYDTSGVILDESTLNFGDSVIYLGVSNSFLSIPNSEDFLFSHALYADGIGEGLIMKFSNTLDTIWSKAYNQYDPDTYFYTHAPSTNGFIIAGEHVVTEPVGRGTFIMEIDSEGEVLWHNEIHAPEDGLFRNVSISQFGDNYIVSGTDQMGNDSYGYIEILNSSGELVGQELAPDPGIGGGGQMYHFQNGEGEVVVYQTLSSEYFEPPSLAYNSVRVYILEVGDIELSIQAEYMDDDNWIGGNVRKMIEVSDGYVLAGGYREPLNGVNQRKAWIMKIDNNFQQEWYTELSYDDAPGNAHYPYDMEQTSDGGYVLVGAYRNSADFYDRTWLVKVDACGDLEWQGCEPVGLGEWQLKPELSLYPNPASDFLNIESSNEMDAEAIEVLDLSGRVLMNVRYESRIDVSTLKSGIYLLRIMVAEGVIHSEKLIVE